MFQNSRKSTLPTSFGAENDLIMKLWSSFFRMMLSADKNKKTVFINLCGKTINSVHSLRSNKFNPGMKINTNCLKPRNCIKFRSVETLCNSSETEEAVKLMYVCEIKRISPDNFDKF